MPISKDKTRIMLTIDKELLAWVDTQAKAEYRDRNNWIIAQILNIKKEATTMNFTPHWLIDLEENKNLIPATKKDEQAIIEMLKKEIELRVDDNLRVWTEGGIYIADLKEVGEATPMKKIFNGENFEITVVTDLQDVVIPAKSYAEVAIPENVTFNSDSFYVQEEGDWYAKSENCGSGADIEIYKA
ncbi:MAG: hypothetical protein ACYDG4_10710 [Desulfuromonadaceae bacterium]